MLNTRRLGWPAFLACLLGTGVASGQGLILPGAGPINLSMGGASTAAAVDVGGSYWNPAVISGLPRSEMLLSSQFLFPSIHLQTSFPAGSILPGLPRLSQSGTSRSDSGVAAVPTAIIAFRLADDSPWTFSMGSQFLVGGGVNFPGSAGTPVLAPHNPPQSFGFGPVYANMAVGISTLTASRQVTDRLAVAAGPVIAVESVTTDPAVFAAPVNGFLNGGYPTFPSAFRQRPFWGAGFQVGLLYELSDDWNLGFSYKSPVWQERWGYNGATATGAPNRIGVQAGLPEVFSWGVAYKGFERALIDVDFRYLDYANTPLFGDAAPPQGVGMGWSSVFAVAVGGQYQATEKLTLRAGYLFNTNPVPGEKTLLNVQIPAIMQHMLALGASYRLTDDITLSLAWTHQFRAASEGRIFQFPATMVREDVQADSLVAGLTVQFGGKRKVVSVPAVPGQPPPLPVPLDPAVSPAGLSPEPDPPGAESGVVRAAPNAAAADPR